MIGMIAKAIVGSATAAAGAMVTALQDGHINLLEWVAILAAFLVQFGAVHWTPNVRAGFRIYSKAIVAALIAGLGAFGTAMLNGTVTPNEWVVIVTAALAGSGLVYTTPNAPESVDIPPPGSPGITPSRLTG